jgi:hypothetical protein
MTKPKSLSAYADTRVPPAQSKAEITDLLDKQGVTTYAWITKDGDDVLVFEWTVKRGDVEKTLAFEFRPPKIMQEKKVWSDTESKLVKTTVLNKAVAYRLLFNYLKNKLVAVQQGYVTLETEFMAQIKISGPRGESTTLGKELVPLMIDRRLENALTYTPETDTRPREKPLNITHDAEIVPP